MAVCVDAAWAKFVQYYAMTDDVVAYFFATALNPIYKWNYFDKYWGSVLGLRESLWASKQGMRQFWEDKYMFQTGLATSRFVFNQGMFAFNGFINWIQQQMDRE